MMRCTPYPTFVFMIGVAILLGACDEQGAEAHLPALSAVREAEADGPTAPCCPVDDKAGAANGVGVAGDGVGAAQPATTQPATQPTTQPGESNQSARASEWVKPADRQAFDLDYKMTDQDGNSLSLEDLKGKPIAMSFIFTRCPNPQMCPLIVTAMARLQNDLEQAGLADQVWLTLLSYDPVFDTPARLKRYGADRGLRFTNAKMLRPDPNQFRELLHEFQIGVDYNADGSIGHFIELLVIDHKGRFVRDYQGDIWSNQRVLDDLKKLVAESGLTERVAKALP